MHGLKGGGWKRKRPGHGHHGWDDLAGNRGNADPGTYHRLAPPRLPPTLLRPGVSSATFAYLSHYLWQTVWRWIRRKHRRSTWKQLRHRYCGGRWWPQGQDRELFDPEKVSTTRYRYRGSIIPSPWPQTT